MKIPNQIIPDVFKMSKKVYEKEMTLTEASDYLFNNHGLNINSARDYINDFKALMEGREFKRTLNAFSMEYFICEIGNVFGKSQLEKALQALQQHIKYYEGTHTGAMNKLRSIHKKYSTMK